MYAMNRTPAMLLLLLVTGGCSDNAAPHGANVQSVFALGSGACGHTDSRLVCWGDVNLLSESFSSPAPLAPGAPYGSLQFMATSSFDVQACGIDQGASLFCWSLSSPYGAVAPGLRFTQVGVGLSHKCALATGGTIYCWGDVAVSGVDLANPAVVPCDRAGSSTALCVMEPVAVAGDEQYSAVAVGEEFSCGLALDGQVLCWGYGAVGQAAGDGHEQVPTAIASSDHFTAIAAAGARACAVNSAGAVLCWGDGPIGNGETSSPAPAAVAFPEGVSIKSVALGSDHSCALEGTGTAWCWGSGGLGTGYAHGDVPGEVLGGLSFRSIAAGNGFSCGITDNGAWCWGLSSVIPVRLTNQDPIDD